MKTIQEIIALLKQILFEQGATKLRLIVDFQSKVFNDEDGQNDIVSEILADLAYDLDFYEPSENLRLTNSSFYSNDHLTELIEKAIKQLEAQI